MTTDTPAKPKPARKPRKSPSPRRNASAVPVPPETATEDAVELAPVQLARVPLAVRWRDLDAFNHVNNSQYLSYLEEARLHWMVQLPGNGLDDDVAPVVAASHLNYRRPIAWPSELLVELFVERLGNTSVGIGHRIVDSMDESVLYCDGHVVLVWIDRGTGRAAALPESVRETCTRR